MPKYVSLLKLIPRMLEFAQEMITFFLSMLMQMIMNQVIKLVWNDQQKIVLCKDAKKIDFYNSE